MSLFRGVSHISNCLLSYYNVSVIIIVITFSGGDDDTAPQLPLSRRSHLSLLVVVFGRSSFTATLSSALWWWFFLVGFLITYVPNLYSVLDSEGVFFSKVFLCDLVWASCRVPPRSVSRSGWRLVVRQLFIMFRLPLRLLLRLNCLLSGVHDLFNYIVCMCI